MARRYFGNFAPTQTLSSGITSSTATLSVPTFSGWPTSYPFTATIDYGTASAEIVLVTNISGSVATVTRGYNGSVATAHLAGASFDLTPVALDFDEASAHVNGTAGVHGVSGSVVGTSDVQTLSNKTFSGATGMGSVNASGTVTAGALTTAGTATAGNLTTSGALNAASATITGNETVQGNLAVSGALTTSGSSTAGSLATSGNGTVSAIPVTRTFTNEAAASAAVSTVNAIVYLSAPTTSGYGAGLYSWTGTVWHPLPGGVMGTVTTSAQALSSGTNGTTEALSALSLTIAGVVAGRNYRIVWGCWYRASVANTNVVARIHGSQSAITTASPVVASVNKWIAQVNFGPEDANEFTWTPGANGTWNLRLGVVSTSGSGNAAIDPGQQLAFLTVYAA